MLPPSARPRGGDGISLGSMGGRQLLEAFPWDSAPHYLLRDRDGSYGEKFHEAANCLGIREVLTHRNLFGRSPTLSDGSARFVGNAWIT